MSRLKQIRIDRNLSQTSITVLTFIPQSDISAIENNKKRVGRRRAERIARALGMEVEELFPELAERIREREYRRQTERKAG